MTPIRSWEDEAMHWSASDPPRSQGYVIIGDRTFDVTKVYLHDSKCCVDILLPPSIEEVSGHIGLWGADGKLVCDGRTYIIPPHDSLVCFTYGLTVSVDSWHEETNLGDLPGWKKGRSPQS